MSDDDFHRKRGVNPFRLSIRNINLKLVNILRPSVPLRKGCLKIDLVIGTSLNLKRRRIVVYLLPFASVALKRSFVFSKYYLK